MGRLLLLFVLVPVAELVLLLQIGRYVGLLPTLALIVVTGTLGAYLARRQGLGVLARVRAELDRGSLPAGELVDGVIILLAGAVLMTPGVLTDVFGFLCLVPRGREVIKRVLKKRFEGAVAAGKIGLSTAGGPGFAPRARPVRDVTPPGDEPRPPIDGDV